MSRNKQLDVKHSAEGSFKAGRLKTNNNNNNNNNKTEEEEDI